MYTNIKLLWKSFWKGETQLLIFTNTKTFRKKKYVNKLIPYMMVPEQAILLFYTSPYTHIKHIIWNKSLLFAHITDFLWIE